MSLKRLKEGLNNPARLNLFYVRITNIGSKGGIDPRPLEFFCKSVTVPGFNLRTFDYNSSNYGISQMIPFGINSEPLNCTFILDSKHSILHFFHNWMNEIYRYDRRSTNSQNQKVYELGYLDEYSSTMEVYYLSSDGTIINGDKYITRLHNVFPTNISSINLSWDDNDSYATLPIQFSYSGIEHDRVINGSGENSFYNIVSGLSSYYFESGRTTHGNSPVTSGTIQEFIDMKAKTSLEQMSDSYKLVSKII